MFGFGGNNNSNDIKKKFIKAKLIDINSLDSSIKVDLVNTNSKKNFFREDFYGDLEKCYLQKEVAIKLKKAQKILKSKNPKYSLLILDGARPRSVSWKMYNKLENTPMQRYVANPKTGSMHNYGAAVDITIVDEKGKEIDMGIQPFRKNLFQLGIMLIKKNLGETLTENQKKNRKLLRDLMTEAKFHPIQLEWWYFNGFEKDYIRSKYEIIE